MVELSVIIPTYNERKNIGILIPEIVNLFKSKGVEVEVLVVDDGSPDGTQEEVLRLGRKYFGVKLVARNKKEGIGAALRDGYNQAKGSIIMSSDADLSFKVSDMGLLYDKLILGYDLVLGSRYARGGYYERKNSRTMMKGVVSIIANKLWSWLFGFGVSDFSANFRVIQKEMWESLGTKEKTNFLLFEMIYRTYLRSGRVGEIPVSFVDRRYGESKLKLSIEAPKAILKMFSYLFRYRLGLDK